MTDPTNEQLAREIVDHMKIHIRHDSLANVNYLLITELIVNAIANTETRERLAMIELLTTETARIPTAVYQRLIAAIRQRGGTP